LFKLRVWSIRILIKILKSELRIIFCIIFGRFHYLLWKMFKSLSNHDEFHFKRLFNPWQSPISLLLKKHRTKVHSNKYIFCCFLGCESAWPSWFCCNTTKTSRLHDPINTGIIVFLSYRSMCHILCLPGKYLISSYMFLYKWTIYNEKVICIYALDLI
jgi:hypothetical protein